MFREYKITDVRVKKDKLFLHVKDEGDLYIVWNHTFPTRILSINEKKKLYSELSNHPILKEYLIEEGGFRRRPNGEQIFPNLHITIPLQLKNILKEEFPTNKYTRNYKKNSLVNSSNEINKSLESKNSANLETIVGENSNSFIDKNISKKKLDSIFIFGNYTGSAQERFLTPSSIAFIDKEVVEVINHTNKYNRLLKQLRLQIKEEYFDKSKSYQTRVFNELEKLFWKSQTGFKRNKELKETSYTKNIPEKLIDKRKRIMNIKNKIDERVKDIPVNIELTKEKTLDVVLQNINSITPVKQMTYEDFLNEKWLFFDIEIPLFQDESESEISWVGMSYWRRDKITGESKLRNEMHTLRTLGRKTYKGFHIYEYSSEKELTAGVADSIKRQDPYVISAYNAKFDVLNLRESGDFAIGVNEKTPYQNVTIPFFESLGLEGREIFDLLRWSQITYDYLPNRKLELVSRTTLPELFFTKSITYDEMAEKELVAKYSKDKQNRLAMAREIADYLIGDVEIMPKLFLSDAFQKHFRFSCELSQIYKISIDKFLYSPRSINKIQERSYFKAVGIPRDKVLYRTLKSREEVSKAKQDFRVYLSKLNEINVDSGVYSNVHLFYLNYGKALKNIILSRLPEADHVLNKVPVDSIENHLFGRFGNSIAEWITSDFTILKKLESKYHKTLSKLGVSETHFLDVYISQKITFSYDKTSNLQMQRGNISVKQFENNINPKTRKFIEDYGVSSKVFLKLFDLKRRFLKFRNRFRGQFGVEESFVENALKKQINDLKNFVFNNGLTILHQEGPYVYVQGDVEGVKKSFPQVVIQSFDDVLLTKDYSPGKDNKLGRSRIYYNTFNIFKGLKLVDHATHVMNLFEQDTFGGFIKNLLSRNPSEALSYLKNGSFLLSSKSINKEELVWFAKSVGRYSAYEGGEKIYFYENIPSDVNTGSLVPTKFDDLTKRDYVSELINGKDRKTYIISRNDFEPDWSLYNKKFKKDLFNVSYSLLGDKVNAFIDVLGSNNSKLFFNDDFLLEDLINKMF